MEKIQTIDMMKQAFFETGIELCLIYNRFDGTLEMDVFKKHVSISTRNE